MDSGPITDALALVTFTSPSSAKTPRLERKTGLYLQPQATHAGKHLSDSF